MKLMKGGQCDAGRLSLFWHFNHPGILTLASSQSSNRNNRAAGTDTDSVQQPDFAAMLASHGSGGSSLWSCSSAVDCGLESAVGDGRLNDGSRPERLELFHRVDDIASPHHHAHGAPVGFFERIDGGGLKPWG